MDGWLKKISNCTPTKIDFFHRYIFSSSEWKLKHYTYGIWLLFRHRSCKSFICFNTQFIFDTIHHLLIIYIAPQIYFKSSQSFIYWFAWRLFISDRSIADNVLSPEPDTAHLTSSNISVKTFVRKKSLILLCFV